LKPEGTIEGVKIRKTGKQSVGVFPDVATEWGLLKLHDRGSQWAVADRLRALAGQPAERAFDDGEGSGASGVHGGEG